MLSQWPQIPLHRPAIRLKSQSSYRGIYRGMSDYWKKTPATGMAVDPAARLWSVSANVHRDNTVPTETQQQPQRWQRFHTALENEMKSNADFNPEVESIRSENYCCRQLFTTLPRVLVAQTKIGGTLVLCHKLTEATWRLPNIQTNANENIRTIFNM